MNNGYEWRLSIKYNPDQPRVPAGQTGGGQWTSSGAQIKEVVDEFGDTYIEMSGGDWPAKVRLSTPSRPPDDYPVSHRWATIDEQKHYLQLLDEQLPPEIKALWHARAGQPVLAITPSGQRFGLNDGNFIFIDEDTFADPNATMQRHEFIHNIMRQDMFDRTWPSYRPDNWFSHALEGKRGMRENEDLTMLLTYFDKDKIKWVDNMVDRHRGDWSRLLEREVLSKKVEVALDYLRYAMEGL